MIYPNCYVWFIQTITYDVSKLISMIYPTITFDLSELIRMMYPNYYVWKFFLVSKLDVPTMVVRLHKICLLVIFFPCPEWWLRWSALLLWSAGSHDATTTIFVSSMFKCVDSYDYLLLVKYTYHVLWWCRYLIVCMYRQTVC